MNRTQTKKTEVLYYKHKLMRKTWPRGHGVVGSWCKQSCCSCSFIFIFKPGHIDCRHHHRIFHGRFGAISMATKRVTVLIPRLHWMSFLERWSVEDLSMNGEGVRKFWKVPIRGVDVVLHLDVWIFLWNEIGCHNAGIYYFFLLGRIWLGRFSELPPP